MGPVEVSKWQRTSQQFRIGQRRLQPCTEAASLAECLTVIAGERLGCGQRTQLSEARQVVEPQLAGCVASPAQAVGQLRAVRRAAEELVRERPMKRQLAHQLRAARPELNRHIVQPDDVCGRARLRHQCNITRKNNQLDACSEAGVLATTPIHDAKVDNMVCPVGCSKGRAAVVDFG